MAAPVFSRGADDGPDLLRRQERASRIVNRHDVSVGGLERLEAETHRTRPGFASSDDSPVRSDEAGELRHPVRRRRDDGAREGDRSERLERARKQRPARQRRQSLRLGASETRPASGCHDEKEVCHQRAIPRPSPLLRAGSGRDDTQVEDSKSAVPAQTARISCSFVFSRSSTSLIFLSVSFWDSSRPRRSSSSEIFLSLNIFLIRSLPSWR